MTQLINVPVLTISTAHQLPTVTIGINVVPPVLTIRSTLGSIKTSFISCTPALNVRVSTDSVFVIKYFGLEFDSLTTSNITFETGDGDLVPFTVSSNSFSGGFNTFTITPTSELTENISYTITLLTTLTAGGEPINQKDLIFWTELTLASYSATESSGTLNDVYYKQNLISELLDISTIVESAEKFNYNFAPTEYNRIDEVYSYANDRLDFDLKTYFKSKIRDQYLHDYEDFFDNLASFGVLSTSDFKDLEKVLYTNSYNLNTSSGLLKKIKFILDIYAKAAGYHFVSVDAHPYENFVYYITTDIPRDYWSSTLKSLIHPLSWEESFISLPTYNVEYDLWATTIAYTLGDRIMTDDWVLECTTSGTSGSGAEPIWNNYITGAGDTYIIDGLDGLVWTCIEALGEVHNYQTEKYQWTDTILNDFRDFFNIKGEDRALTSSYVTTNSQIIIRGTDNIYLKMVNGTIPARIVREIGDWEFDRVINESFVYLNGTLVGNDGEYTVDDVVINTTKASDDGSEDNTADWTAEDVNISIAFDTDHYEITAIAADKYISLTDLSFVYGRSYKVNVYIKDGTATSETLKIRFNDGAEQFSTVKTTTSSWQSVSSIFEAVTSTASGQIGIELTSDLSADNIEIKLLEVSELSQIELIVGEDFFGNETITINDSIGSGSYLNFDLNNDAKGATENGIYIDGVIRPDPDTNEAINDPTHALYEWDAVSSKYPSVTIDNWARSIYERYNDWVAVKYYIVGDKIMVGGFVWNCTTTGTSGIVEPTWATTFVYETEVIDNTVIWSMYETIETTRRDLLNVLNNLQYFPRFIPTYLEYIIVEDEEEGTTSQTSQIIYGTEGNADANVAELFLVRGSAVQSFSNSGEDITFLYETEANPIIFIESTTFSTSSFSFGNTSLENDERHNAASNGNIWNITSISDQYDYEADDTGTYLAHPSVASKILVGPINLDWQDVYFHSSTDVDELSELMIGEIIDLQGSAIDTRNEGYQYVYRTDAVNRVITIKNMYNNGMGTTGGVPQTSAILGDLTGQHRITTLYNMETYVVPGLFSFDAAMLSGFNLLVNSTYIDPSDYKAIDGWLYHYWKYVATVEYADTTATDYASFISDIEQDSHFSHIVTNTNYDASNISYKSYAYSVDSVPSSWNKYDLIYEYSVTGNGVLFGRIEATDSVVLHEDSCAADNTADWDTTATITFDVDHYNIEINGTTNTTANIPYLTFTAGKVYQFSCRIKDGSATGATFDFLFDDGASQNSVNFTTTSTWQLVAVEFTAASSTYSGIGSIRIAEDLLGNNIQIKEFSIDNVTDNKCVMCLFNNVTDVDDVKYYSTKTSIEEYVLPTDFIAHYTMDNISGTTLVDETSSFDGTLIDSPIQVAGYINNALDFTDSYIDCSTTMGTALGDDCEALAVSFWFNTDATDSDDGLFYIGDFSSSDGEFKISIESDTILFELSNAAFTEDITFTDTSGWHHIVAMYTGYKGQLYLDNTLVIDAEHTTDLDLNGLKTIIAACYDDTFAFNGLMDQVKIFDRALTTDEITLLYNETAVGALGDYGALGSSLIDLQLYDRKIEIAYNVPDFLEYNWITSTLTDYIEEENRFTFFGVNAVTYTVTLEVNVKSWNIPLTLTTTDDLTFAPDTGLLKRQTGSWAADGLTVGHVIYIQGAAKEVNNGYFKIARIKTQDNPSDSLLFETNPFKNEIIPGGLPLNTIVNTKVIQAMIRNYYTISPTSLINL